MLVFPTSIFAVAVLRGLLLLVALVVALVVGLVLDQSGGLLLLRLNLQEAVIAESNDVDDHSTPNDLDVRVARQLVNAEEGQQQRKEDKGCLVEVATEGRGGGRECVHDGELNNVVHEGEHAGEHEPADRALVQAPHASQDFIVRHPRLGEHHRPLAGHRLLQKHSDWQQEERRRNGHVRNGVINVEFGLSQDTCKCQVKGTAEERRNAHDDTHDH
mmetsp:Transcript_56130/g.142251  ORF Transcript_56130/g.142251 Transcript_56130/m.142251 type:complete len:216 (-) Transcript_56130:976-1623(-)